MACDPILSNFILAISVAQPEQAASIRALNQAAFAGSEEADLVEKLVEEGHSLLSLVAILNGQVVGHALFSRMWIRGRASMNSAVALAPIAVLPSHQRQGLGAKLITVGIEAMSARGERIILVVGHPDYYPKFGFSSEKTTSIESPFPPEAFMALELVPGSLDGLSGKVIYPPPFGI